MPLYKDYGRGDLYIHFTVEFPQPGPRPFMTDEYRDVLDEIIGLKPPRTPAQRQRARQDATTAQNGPPRFEPPRRPEWEQSSGRASPNTGAMRTDNPWETADVVDLDMLSPAIPNGQDIICVATGARDVDRNFRERMAAMADEAERAASRGGRGGPCAQQ